MHLVLRFHLFFGNDILGLKGLGRMTGGPDPPRTVVANLESPGLEAVRMIPGTTVDGIEILHDLLETSYTKSIGMTGGKKELKKKHV